MIYIVIMTIIKFSVIPLLYFVDIPHCNIFVMYSTPDRTNLDMKMNYKCIMVPSYVSMSLVNHRLAELTFMALVNEFLSISSYPSTT